MRSVIKGVLACEAVQSEFVYSSRLNYYGTMSESIFAYQVVKYDKSKKNRRRRTAEGKSTEELFKETAENLAKTCKEWLAECHSQLSLLYSLSSSLKRSLDILLTASQESGIRLQEVLCLGLGSPTSSCDARVQLAYLLSLCENFGIASTLSS